VRRRCWRGGGNECGGYFLGGVHAERAGADGKCEEGVGAAVTIAAVILRGRRRPCESQALLDSAKKALARRR